MPGTNSGWMRWPRSPEQDGAIMCGAWPRRSKASGLALTGCDLTIHSTVPLESGLSSSAALECAVATMFAGLGGWSLAPERMALLCQKAENDFAGVKCGILDQYSSCLGREGCALLLDCRDSRRARCGSPMGFASWCATPMSRRRLSGSEYAQRRAECEVGAARLGVRRAARGDAGNAGGETAGTPGAGGETMRLHRG